MAICITCPHCHTPCRMEEHHVGARLLCFRCKQGFVLQPVAAAPLPAGCADKSGSAIELAPSPEALTKDGKPQVGAASRSAPDTEEPPRPLSLERVYLAWIDRVLPAHPVPFLLVVFAVSALFWILGLLLAPDRGRFLATPEWQAQPFFLAVHFIILRLFVTAYTRNFLAGVSHIDIVLGEAMTRMRRILGFWGAGAALLAASPLCAMDFMKLYGGEYGAYTIGTDAPEAHPEYLTAFGADPGSSFPANLPWPAFALGNSPGDSQPAGLGPEDLLMFTIWCLEWVLNAYIWVILVGFLLLVMRILRRHQFRDSVEKVLHQKQYRPFLLMSVQGASILLGFSVANAAYVWYTNGELTDYIGIGITTGLLLVGFMPPWIKLKAKVEALVREETFQLQALLMASRRQEPLSAAGKETDSVPELTARMDQALMMLRIGYLERLHQELGRSEGKAVLLRLLAPATTIAWKFLRPLHLGM